MSPNSQDFHLFGLDLRALWHSVRSPWQNMHRWPALAWLTPEIPIRVLRTNGEDALWQGSRQELVPLGENASTTRFQAVELPEERILRRSLVLPALPDAETFQAVSLEIHALSPFAASDLVWGYSAGPAEQGVVRIEAAMASRKQVEHYVQSLDTRLQGAQPPEVWAPLNGKLPIVMAGFGESKRTQYAGRKRHIGYALLALLFGIVIALAVTPTAQLRLRAVEAVNAYTEVHVRTLPLAQRREELVKTTERLGMISEMMGGRVDPLRVLDLLTQALPDNTSLLNLSVQGLKVNVSGQTANAAVLMQHLSTQPGIRDVKAPSAAIRPLGVNKDSFTIEFTLDPKALVPAAAVAVSAGAVEPAAVPPSPASAAASAPTEPSKPAKP